MLKAKRANVILRINDNQADYYAAKGYTIYDMNGEIVKEHPSKEAGVEILKKQNEEYSKKVAELEDAIANLEDENANLKKELDELKTTKEVVAKSSAEEVIEKPKKKNK